MYLWGGFLFGKKLSRTSVFVYITCLIEIKFDLLNKATFYLSPRWPLNRIKIPPTNTSTLKQYNQHVITKLKHIMQAKSRKGDVKETRTEVHVASASLSPCSGCIKNNFFYDMNIVNLIFSYKIKLIFLNNC
jgi:hypothetical protein